MWNVWVVWNCQCQKFDVYVLLRFVGLSVKMPFNLKSSNPEFSQRQRNIFDQLKVIENNRKNTSANHEQMETDQQPDSSTDRKRQRAVTKHFRGKESIFKKPQNPAPKNFINRIPDFKKNPHKWTKYSLEDVKDEDISEKGNANAAFSFLKQLKERKSLEMESNDSNADSRELPTKIIFKRHTSLTVKAEDDVDDKPSFKSSKVVMPEYIVGQKVKKEKKTKNENASGKGKELKLDHLLEDDDEDDN